MTLTKLISMSDFVKEVLNYVSESKNNERGIFLIKQYSEFLDTDLDTEFFKGKNPLFPDFKVIGTQNEAIEKRYKNSFWYFGSGQYATTLYRKSEHSKTGNAYISSYHLRKISDLCDKEIYFDCDCELAPELFS